MKHNKHKQDQDNYRTQVVLAVRRHYISSFFIAFYFLLLSFSSFAQYKGGPHDGATLNQTNCPPRPPLPDTGKVAYTGRSHGGFSVAVISCPVITAATLTEIYTGGSHDGFALASISCPPTGETTLTNVYTGGAHDGAAVVAISCSVTGPTTLTDIYTGGSHDGAATAAVSCPVEGPTTLTNIYTGGPYDGFAQSAVTCPPRPPLPDTGRVAYSGGSHGGFARAVISCPVAGASTLTNIFKGGSHNGFGITSVSCLAAAATTLTNIFKGASYDGFASADMACPTAAGPAPLTDVFTGGPHDGFAMTHVSCPTEPLFTDSIAAQNIICGGQCNGAATSYPANGTAPYTYYWNTHPVQTTQTATGLCAGAYSVTVTDAAYNTATATHNVTQPVPLVVTVAVTNASCDSSNGKATANPTGGTTPYLYNWSTTPLQTTRQATGLAAGNYTVTVSDSSNCSATAVAVISGAGGTLVASVSISASANPICTGTHVTFTAVPANGGLSPSYQWKVNGANAGANSPAFSDSSLNNNDVVSCVMTSDAGCVTGSPATSNPITISVVQHAQAGMIVPDNDTICSGTTGHLTDVGATGNVQWQSSPTPNNFTDIPGAASSSYTTPPLTQSTYYRLYITGGTCTDTSSVLELIATPAPAPPVLTATDTAICPNDSAQLCAANTFVSYLWTTGDTTPCIYTIQAGTYWVSVTASGGCSTTSNHINILVHTAPSAFISQQGDSLISTTAANYQWYFNDTLIPGATNRIYIARQTGNYTVQVTDSNGCVALSKIFPYVAIGIKELSNPDRLEIYPNPVPSGWFNVSYSGTANKSYHLNILNLIGEKVAEEILSFNAGKTTIPVNISQLPKGVYLLQFQSEHLTVMRKIVLQ